MLAAALPTATAAVDLAWGEGGPATGAAWDAAQPAGPDLADRLADLLRGRPEQDAVRDLLRALHEPHAGELAKAVALAKIGTRHQAETLGLPWTAPPEGPRFDAPSEALLALAERHGVAPTPAQREDVLALDALAEPLRGALARFVAAFLAFDDAARQAYANADPDKLQALMDAAEARRDAPPADGAALPATWNPLAEAGVDLAPVFPARNALLDAIVALRDAVDATPPAPHGAPASTLDVCPAFALDLAGVPDTYTADCALILDVGGNDVYHNNAGGSNLAGGVCVLEAAGAAALVDLAGTDQYGNPLSPRECGANGGGYIGAGFLLDGGPEGDVYTVGGRGTNGGGTLGMGFLVDAGSQDDTYTTYGGGANGGSYFGGMGFLLDMDGADTYTTAGLGTNGGSYMGGGLLLDAGGADTYATYGNGANGGGERGWGFLLDAGSEGDTYTAGRFATNGGGLDGVGFLLDAGGTDTYTAGGCGTNGASGFGCRLDLTGVGLLLDAGGTGDTYTDTDSSCNGSGTDRTVLLKCTAGTQMDVPPSPPTGVKSCAAYNAIYAPSPYPGQDTGVVVEFDPAGPDGDVAVCLGSVTGSPCAPGQPGVLVNNAPLCVPPAPTLCSLSGGGPGPGWTVGVGGTCVGLPWVEPGGASPCPTSAAVNARIHWGTTPGFTPGSTFDVCI